jgi:hypothetical protein
MMFRLLFACLLFLPSSLSALEISAGGLTREFSHDGKNWRTSAFITPDGRRLTVTSDEFHLRTLDDKHWTVDDYQSDGKPDLTEQSLVFTYTWPANKPRPENAPARVTIRHHHDAALPYLRKQIQLEFDSAATIDRLEVERFTTVETAERGGRGEPVWIGGRWFFGLEHPAGHSRHSDGNTPLPDSHRYELVGNYSFVDLEQRDRETQPRPGLVRLFHFPGFAQPHNLKWSILSQSSITGASAPGEPMENAFLRYLASIAKPDRSFTHYNNWFDGAGKSLKGDNFLNIHRQFKEALKDYNVRIDAMVPDDGWQDRNSVWKPSPGHFPNGFDDLRALSESMIRDGTTLGLWLALDGTNTNIAWGESQGFKKAKPNPYFSQYFAHYSLSADGYRQELEKQLRKLAGDAKISYLKHDFNHLSDTAEGRNHPPTDRHGHEANVDAMIHLLAATRDANPTVYQNLTNWIWFSPWWLPHGDALWMLAGDDGFNGNWPELSTRAMATTDRDTYLWRMWGDPADRPLVPISRLMTHGIIRNPGGQMESKQDSLRDWADHVMMYYGRGIQMKEWYISPTAMTPDHWKSLATIHRWSERNFKALANNRWIGGRPDEGHAYGYIGWHENNAVLVARNPGPAPQTLQIPFNPTTGYLGKTSQPFSARVVYPHHRTWPASFSSGKTIEIEIPGYETLALEFTPGTTKITPPAKPDLTHSNKSTPSTSQTTLTLPPAIPGRSEILVIGYPTLPEVKINGQPASPLRTSKSALNQYAGYARAGMPSDRVRPWQMASYDLRNLLGKPVTLDLSGTETELRAEAWLLLETPQPDEPFDPKDLPWPISANTLRHTHPLIPERPFTSSVSQRTLTPAELKSISLATLHLEVFGISEGFGTKSLLLNGTKIADLPHGPDAWQPCRIELTKETIANLRTNNLIEIHTDRPDDKFKFRALHLRIELPNGEKIRTTLQSTPQTSSDDWTHFEGDAFLTPKEAKPVALDFTNS